MLLRVETVVAFIAVLGVSPRIGNEEDFTFTVVPGGPADDRLSA
jgi:hypothetical protein